MPSDHFIKDDENPNDILISEDEYINKYKNGEIPEGCVSPYIYEKLKKEENNNMPQNIEQKVELTPRIINNSYKKTNHMNIERSKNLNKKRKNKTGGKSHILRKKNLIKESLLLKKQYENEKIIKHFINNNWNFEEELSFPKFHNINCSSLKEENIIDDINKFGKKKQNFISNISLFNSKSIPNIHNY